MSGAAAGLHLPATVFTRFSDAVAARDAIDGPRLCWTTLRACAGCTTT